MIGFTLPMTLLMAAAVLPAGPLDFKARNMRIEPQERRVVLEGDVQLTRGDLSVTGQHAVAEYAKEQPASAQRPRGRQSACRSVFEQLEQRQMLATSLQTAKAAANVALGRLGMALTAKQAET